MQDEQEIITILEKARGETIKVYVMDFAGKRYLHIREWYLDKNQLENPGKRGVAIPLEKVDVLLEAIKKVMENESAP